jgi:hypothetical protein
LGAETPLSTNPIQTRNTATLARHRSRHACGAVDIIAEMYGAYDDEAIVNQPVYMGF